MQEDEKWLAARLKELATRAAQRQEFTYSLFLDPSQAEVAQTAAFGASVMYMAQGGYEGAERCIYGFYPKHGADEPKWPIAALKIDWNVRFGKASHRDLLGSLMALGFKREVLGDILVLDDHAICFVHETVAGYISAQLEKVGNTPVKVTAISMDQAEAPRPDWTIRQATVASLRLDAIMAAAYQLSRTQAQQAILQNLVKVNHKVELRGDAKLEEGDMISFRGHGRAVLEQVGNTTKKSRVHIIIKCTK